MNSWLLLALAGVADSALVVVVDGIPADQLTKRVVQHAVDDVIPIVEAPEQVIDVEFFPVPGFPSSVRIESTVRMGDPWRTCGEVGFRNAQDCHDGVDLPYDAPPSLAVSLVASMEKAIANGKFVDRLLYWAAELNVSGNTTGWENVTVVPPPDSLNPVFPPNSTYVFNTSWRFATPAPTATAAPTATFAPTATAMPTATLAPTTQPTTNAPTSSPAPTSTPAPSQTHAPTVTPGPTPGPTLKPTRGQVPIPAPTAAPTVEVRPRGSKKKKKSRGLASGEIAGIIIACIAGGCCILAACLALCAHHNREGKHDKQAKPWEPSTPASHSGPAPHSLDLVSTKEHGDDVPEAIRKLEANDNAV